MKLRYLCLVGMVAALTWLLSHDAANGSIVFSDALPAPDRMVAAQATPQPPDLGIRKLRGELPHLQSGSVEPTSVNAPAATELVPWSQLVFQSYRNGNWEIYRANGDGSGQTRLTSDGAMDISPRLNRGCTRIVFVSNRQGNYEIFTMNTGGSGLARLTSTDANEHRPAWSPDGTRIAFASYRDGQSEIYVMNANGSGQRRLTWDGGYDGEPAWSPDGTRIAFASTRTGNYRIWVMNADGSGQAQLSYQPTSEYPAWSPDGSRIAYDADGNGDGWQELWLMKADGTDQHLVYDPPESQTDAWAGSWSADGRYVAFTRISLVYYQGNWYWTTAYLDAWDSRDGGIVRLSNSGEDWNPDWGTLDATPPSSQMNPLPSQAPSPIPVSWSGADIGPAGVHSYDVQVRDGSGAWMDWRMGIAVTSAQYPGVGGHTYFFRVRARDTAGNLEAWPADYDAMTRVEALPPQTAVEPLPAYVRGTAVTVSWAGSDPGGSGIERYDIQVRDGASGSWTDWQTGTIATEAEFSGELGHLYSFRSRGTDRAQNLEPWPPGNGDASTTLYASSLTSMVRDNREAPLPGVTLTSTPPPLGIVSDEVEGTYVAYFAEEAQTHATSWSKADFTSLPPTSLLVAQDLRFDAFLPPGDNIVANWGFEEGSSGWTASGEIMPVITDTVRHTGVNAALLGQSSLAFKPSVNISQDSSDSWRPQAVVDASGAIHVVWGGDGIHYARRDPDGTWSSPQKIVDVGYDSFDPVMAIDSGGNLHVVWRQSAEPPEVFYIRRDANGTWSTPENISDTPETYSWGPRLAVDEGGSVHVVWFEFTLSDGERRGHVSYARREPSGAWSVPLNLSGDLADADSPELAVESTGIVHVVWSSPTPEAFEILYARQSATGTWSAPQNISNSLWVSNAPALAVETSGRLHVIWSEICEGNADTRYAWRAPDGTWSSTETAAVGVGGSSWPQVAVDDTGAVHAISGSSYLLRSPAGKWSSPTGLGSAPHMVISANGDVQVVWFAWPSAGASEVFYARRYRDGIWSSPENLSGSPGASQFPRLAVDLTGMAHVVWEDDSLGNVEVYYAEPLRAEAGGNSELAQTVAIPAEAVNPTLSFLYRLEGTPEGGANWLEVQIQQGPTATTVFSTTASVGAWRHRGFDLTPWKGNSLSLRFSVHQTAGRLPVWAYVDEVTLGSAYPDPWVDKQGPLTAPPGGPLTYTIRYGNRGGVLANGVRITDALPAEIENWDATPYPDVVAYPLLTWDLGDVGAGSTPAEIVLQASVKPDVIPFRVFTNTVQIASASPELELANNVAEAGTKPAYYVYLPVVLR